MPELPEVETIAATLAPQLIDRVVEAVTILDAKAMQAGARRIVRVLPGARVLRVHRRGKLLLIDLAAAPVDGEENPLLLAFHLKMSGRLLLDASPAAPPPHARMVLRFTGKGALAPFRLIFDDARRFGYCRLMRPQDLQAWPFWRELGPEPLELDEASFCALCQNKRGAVKALLLNQRFLAGIGNIYADEACFRSAVRPDAPMSSLSPQRLVGLYTAIQAVLRQAIAECGSSIRNYRDANGNAGAFQNSFQAYGRGGLPCLRCGATLQRAKVAGRGTVFCPRCQ